jgi:uncharacterized protein YndB with AHSA1/START domain
MPTTNGTRTFAATREELWNVLGDPHHLPRWWPRVTRVEAVDQDSFTEVLTSSKGKMVRADFNLVDSVPGERIVWAQQIENTPFERILQSAETEISLSDADDLSSGHGTTVTIELRQMLQGAGRASSRSIPGLFPQRVMKVMRFGGFLVKRAADTTIEEAFDGLERIVGSGA